MAEKIKKIKDFLNKEKCACGNIATWLYMPGGANENPFYCDDCVNRGCSCNYHHANPEDFHPPLDEGEKPEGIEGIDWKWVEKKSTEDESTTTKRDGLWVNLDEKGREYPCCEYDYSEDGFDKD